MCDIAWYTEFLRLNPDAQRRRDAIVKYAEGQSDQVKTYLRRMFPRFWFEVDFIPPGQIGPKLALTVDDEHRILGDMSDAVRPSLPASAVFSRASAVSPAVPKGVHHV